MDIDLTIRYFDLNHSEYFQNKKKLLLCVAGDFKKLRWEGEKMGMGRGSAAEEILKRIFGI